MNTDILVNILFNISIFIIFVLFCKSYLPKYMDQKGKNLATKEDIKEITQKTEEVKIQFQKDFFKFSSESKFKEDYYCKQYSELYSKLYAIICQSEYFRYFNKVYGEKEANFEEYPFFEIIKKSTHEKRNLFSGEILENQVVEVNDSITSFNKKEICEYIIANSNLASRKLLKLAVAYRFANDHYSGSKTPTNNKDWLEGFNDEELRLIGEIIKTIIKDYNKIAKDLKFDYNKSELKTGIFEDLELKSQ